MTYIVFAEEDYEWSLEKIEEHCLSRFKNHYRPHEQNTYFNFQDIHEEKYENILHEIVEQETMKEGAKMNKRRQCTIMKESINGFLLSSIYFPAILD